MDGALRSEEGTEDVSLDDLFAWFRDPAKDYCRHVLELSLHESQESEDDEPFAHSALENFALHDAVLERLRREPFASDATLAECLRAQGVLRPGRLGDGDARDAIAKVRQLTAAYAARFGSERPAARDVDTTVGGYRLRGRLDATTSQGPVRLRAGNARGSDWLSLATMARLAGADAAWFVGFEKGAATTKRLDAARVDEAWLEHALALFTRSRAEYLPLTRYASWEYATVAHEKGDEAGRSAAQTRFARSFREEGKFYEIDDPHVALLWRGRSVELDEGFVALARALHVPIAGAIADADAP